MGAPTNTRWVAVVPVKALATAKSRLAAGSPEHRQALAGAFAADTISAVRSVSNVELVLVIYKHIEVLVLPQLPRSC